MAVEPEDARLTGQTRNLECRLMALNLTWQEYAIVAPTNWLARTPKATHEGSITPEQSPEPEQHSITAAPGTGARN